MGALLAGIFMLPPAPYSHFTDPTDYLGLGIFVLVSTILSGLSGKLAETEAREKDLRQVLQRTLLSIGDAVISTGADMRVVLMNPVAEDLTGWKEAEAHGKLISEVFRIMQEGSDIAVENPVVKVLQSGTIVGLANHTDLVRRDGKRIPIDDSASPVKAADGSISGVVLIFRDIFQRRQSERNLEAAKQNADSILESISDAFVALDSTWRITYANKEAERLNGLSRTDMLGKNHWDLFPETVGTTVHREYLRAHKDRIPLEFLTFYEPWKRWFDIRVYPAANGGLSVFYQDVTDRNLADAQLKDSEERMRLLIESAKGHAIFGLDMEGHVTNWNVGAERLFLYDRAEILGESAVVLFTPEDRETMALEEELFAAHENGVARYERWHLRRDGMRFWGSGTVTPLRDGNGVLKGFVKVFQDRTQEWLRNNLFVLARSVFGRPLKQAVLCFGPTTRQVRWTANSPDGAASRVRARTNIRAMGGRKQCTPTMPSPPLLPGKKLSPRAPLLCLSTGFADTKGHGGCFQSALCRCLTKLAQSRNGSVSTPILQTSADW